MDLREEIKKIEISADKNSINEPDSKEKEDFRRKFINWANRRKVDESTVEEILNELQTCIDSNSFDGSILEKELTLCKKAYINKLRHHKTYVQEYKSCNFPLGLMLVIKKFSVESLVKDINTFLENKNIELITYDCTPEDIEDIIIAAVEQIIDNDKITYNSYIADSSFADDVYVLMKILRPRQLRSDCIKNGMNFVAVYLRYILKSNEYIKNRELINLSKSLDIKPINAERLCGKYGFSDFSLLEDSKNKFKKNNSAICLYRNKGKAKEKFNAEIQEKRFINKIRKYIF